MHAHSSTTPRVRDQPALACGLHRASEEVLGALATQLHSCLEPHARLVANSAFMFVLGRPAPSSMRPPSPPAGSSGATAFGGSHSSPMGCHWGGLPGLDSCEGSMHSAMRPELGLTAGSQGLGLSLTSQHTGTALWLACWRCSVACTHWLG